MDDRAFPQEEREDLKERYALATERIRQIGGEESVPLPYRDYFRRMAAFILEMDRTLADTGSGARRSWSLEELKRHNRALYEDILPENYGRSYANPAYAAQALGEERGRLLSFLCAEIRGMIVYAYEYRLEDMVILCELFLEVYNRFEEENLPSYRELREILYWFVSDYTDRTVSYRVREQVDPSLSFAADIIREADLSDVRYLYAFGEYISENELATARFLNTLSEEEIAGMARTFTEGYRMGFVKAGKPLERKTSVNIRYTLGFERIVRQAMANFEEMGLSCILYRAAVSSVNRRGQAKTGYVGGNPNKQYDYDHREDSAIYLDAPFVERKLGVLRASYEAYKELARGHAGPAVMETFGETPFVPEAKEACFRLSRRQQKLSVRYDSEAGRLANTYIPGEERSFTIIAYPIQEIGEDYESIFRDTVRVNTLDYRKYEAIQQRLVDALDRAAYVEVKGAGDNRTDMRIQLWRLVDPSRETVFENCVADVNIPVGEVFTSPVLTGTEGVLHVSRVYLNELKYEDLELTFRDGWVTDYRCGNFPDEEEGRRYILDNVLFHHESLPLGEFAIGTNTTAYAMGRKYGIEGRLPILIAEKTGPHFAVGDTCYSWEEDVQVFNPDGKEIVARENEVSALRREDPSKAYMNCHTDITLPYEELGALTAVTAEGERIPIIRDGRFALPGCEELNLPLEELQSLGKEAKKP